MVQTLEQSSAITDRSLMAALFVMARYLAGNDERFKTYLVESYRDAQAKGVSSADLSALRMIAGSIGARI